MKQGLLTLLILNFFSGGVYADTQEKGLIKSFYKKAQHQQLHKKPKECLNTLTQLAKEVSKEEFKNSDYYCNAVSLKAMCLAELGDFAEAKKEISNIYNIDLTNFSGVKGVCKGHIEDMYFYPQILAAAGKYKEAIQYQDKYIEYLRDKNKPQIGDIILALRAKGEFLCKDKNYEKALGTYNYLLSLKLDAYDDLKVKTRKASCYTAMGDYDNALGILSGILADDYSNIQDINELHKFKFRSELGLVRLFKGSILIKLGRSNDLLKLSGEIMEKNDFLAEYHSNFLKAKAYELQKDYKNSLLFIEKAIGVAPDGIKAQVQEYRQKIVSMMD